MAFRGDTAQIPLSNILQALMMNAQEGILTLESETFHARLFILQIGIRPLNYDRESPDLLKSIVLKQKLLTESQFQNIFSTWVPGSSHPGDFLINRRILSVETVENELRQQLEDFIYEIFLIPKLKYEFLAGSDSTDYEIFAPNNLGQVLIYNANGILMETVRREDEWQRFQQAIPSPIEIYGLHQATAEAYEKIPFPQEKVEEIRSLINSENSVQQVIKSSILSAFDVYEILYSFRQADLISPLDLEEKLELATRLRKSLRSKDAISIYHSILLNDPDNTAIRRQLITLMIKCKAKGSDLVDHYLHLATQLGTEDPDQARQYLENALSIDPHNIQALEKLFEQHAVANRTRDALNIARTLVAAAREELDPEVAINLLYKMINFYPGEVAFYHEIAELQVAVNDVDGAVECLKSAAEIYSARKDFQKLRRTYEKIVRLCPSEANQLKRLKEVEKKAQRSRTYLIKFTVASLLGGLIVGAGLIWGIHEHRARKVYGEDIHGMVTVLKHLDEFEQARTILTEFIETFPWTTVTKTAHALTVELDDLQLQSRSENRDRDEKLRYAEKTKLTRVQIECRAKNFSAASIILKSIDLKLLPPSSVKEAEAFRAIIEKYMSTAREYEKRAQIALKRGDYATAHQLRKAILYHYADSPAAKDLELPVYIETVPTGVNVVVDNKILGKTPMPILLNPNRVPRIVLAKHGYKPLSLDRARFNGNIFRPIEMPLVTVRLKKAIEWKYAADGSVECFPVTLENRVFFGTRNGVVCALDRLSGEKIWQFEVDYKMDVTGGLGLWNNLVYFGCSNGLVYVLNAQTGKLIHKVDNATKSLLPIINAPSRINVKSVTFLNCGGKALSAIDVSTGNVVWVKYYKQNRLLGQPLVRDRHVYITSNNGTFLQVSQETGELVRVLTVSTASLNQPGQIHGRWAYFTDADNTVRALDLDGPGNTWAYSVTDDPAPLTVDSDHVIVPMAREVLCLTAAGEPLWRIKIDKEITSQGTIFKNRYICGTKNGYVLCLDLASGKVLWFYKTATGPKEGFYARGAIREGSVYLGSRNGFLYCMEVE